MTMVKLVNIVSKNRMSFEQFDLREGRVMSRERQASHGRRHRDESFPPGSSPTPTAKTTSSLDRNPMDQQYEGNFPSIDELRHSNC